MHRRRLVHPSQMPPPPAHPISNFQSIDFRMLTGKGHYTGWWVPKDVKFWDISGNGIRDLPSCEDDIFARFEITLVPDMLHYSPCSGDEGSRSGNGDGLGYY